MLVVQLMSAGFGNFPVESNLGNMHDTGLCIIVWCLVLSPKSVGLLSYFLECDLYVMYSLDGTHCSAQCRPSSAAIKWIRPKNHSRATKSLWFKASRWELQIRNSSQLSRYRSTQPVKASFVVIVDVDVDAAADVIWRRLFKERIPLLVFF